MAKQNDIEKFRNQIRKDWGASVEDMAREVSKRTEKAYEKVIDQFYDAAAFPYNNPANKPISYYRTLSLVEASNGFPTGENPWNIQKFGDSFFSGIQVDAANIPSNPYRANKYWVFDRAFYRGIHGFSRNDIMTWNKKRGRGYRVALIRVKHIPLVSKPTPKKMMDKEFKEITKKRNLDKIFEEVLSRRFTKYM